MSLECQPVCDDLEWRMIVGRNLRALGIVPKGER